LPLLAAIRFLTSIPLPWWREANQEEFVRSLGYYPVVGFLIGLILAGLSWLLGLFLPSAVVNGLLIVAMAIITGALHLDGFIDTCDGLAAGHKIPEVRKKVMRDSRAGAIGIVAAVLLLLVKYVSLNSVPEPWFVATLVLMPVVSRWAMVYAVFAYPYARPSGLGKELKQATGWPVFTAATVTALAIALVLVQLAGLAIMLGIWVIVMAMAAYFRRMFSGLTGDTYGAINELAEVCVLVIVVLLAHNRWL